MSLSKQKNKKRQKLISNDTRKKCNKQTIDSCLKSKKEFDKAKQKFVKFLDNMCSQIIFMNIKKVQDNSSPIRKSLWEYKWNLYKIDDDLRSTERILRSSGQLSSPYREILLVISQTVFTRQKPLL